MTPQWNMLALAHRIQPQASELQSARIHRTVVRGRLERSFDVSRVVPIGSHARGTAIRSYSDVDMLVVLRRNEAKWGGNTVSSNTVLGRVRDDLKARFAHTEIRRDAQAAVIGFSSTQQSLDVVPSLFKNFRDGRPLYSIPDGFGNWMETSPEAHDRFFAAADEKSGGKLRKLCQLLKWWKFSRSQPIPILSFHVDLLLATSAIAVGVKPYTHCLYQAFRLLVQRECRALQDPCGIGGWIYAAATDSQWQALNNAAQFALQHAQSAVAAEAITDFQEANRQWDIVFHGQY